MLSPFSPQLQKQINELFEGKSGIKSSHSSPTVAKKLAGKKKSPLWLKGLSLLVITVGVGAGFYLTRFNQDLRQQASTGVYGLLTPTPTPVVVTQSVLLDPNLFAQLASEANTNSFVVNPSELGYDPDTVRVTENVQFDYLDQGYWARGYEWHDRESRNEYHSTIWGYTDPGTAQETFEGQGTKSNATYFDSDNIQLQGVNPDKVQIFQSNDPDETINVSFYLGDYYIVVKAKNTQIDKALENLEKLANILIDDLVETSTVTVQN